MAGWYGKLPSIGDFASRRLDPAFIEPWDQWLSSGLSPLDPARLAAYLASPSWRFLLLPGALSSAAADRAWAGVLMPSVDRVGRYFPLTIAQPLATLPVDPNDSLALWQWLSVLDELAAAALHEDWTPEQLDAELAREPSPHFAPRAALPWPDAAQPVVGLPDALAARPDTWLSAAAALAALAPAQRLSLWCSAPPDAPPRALAACGAPSQALLRHLFGPAETARSLQN